VTQIGIELRNFNGTLAVELSLTPAQYRGLYRFASSRDLNFPPRGLLGVTNTERISQALDYAFPRTDRTGKQNITRIRGEIVLANNVTSLGLSLVVTRGAEFNFGPIQLGRRRQEREYISPEGRKHKVPSNG
jgi:hypothetical protein